MKHVQIVRVPGWGLNFGEACFYGRWWSAHIGPWLVLLWQMTDDELHAWDDKRKRRSLGNEPPAQRKGGAGVIGNNIWSDDVRAKLLHILPQPIYHGEAQVRGSCGALRRLSDALTKAAALKQGESLAVEMMTSDGEGYSVTIHPMSDEQMDAGPLPYAQLGLPWEFEK